MSCIDDEEFFFFWEGRRGFGVKRLFSHHRRERTTTWAQMDGLHIGAWVPIDEARRSGKIWGYCRGRQRQAHG